MNRIKPYSAFTEDSLAADFPAAKIIFHADDYTAGSLTWASRKGGLVLTLAAGASKDVGGVYTTVTNSVASVAGTMPTMSKYVVAVTIGEAGASSTSNGIAGTFGDITVGPALQLIGRVYNNTATLLNDTPSLTGSIAADNKSCQASYWDLVDTTTPACYRAVASALSTEQAIQNGTDTTLTTQFILGGALSSGLTFSALASITESRRCKVMALFDFSVALANIGELEIAVSEMARTQELFAGWRNRAAA